jgi:hypothetical protein
MSVANGLSRLVASIWRAAQAAYLWICRLHGAVDVEELPQKLKARRLYVVGEDGQSWFAALLCPCGCGAVIHASLVEASRPHWRLTRHFAGAVSLYPSMWRTKGCRSHFWLRRGRVDWC